MEFSCPDNYPVYCNWYNDRNYAKRYFSCVKNREQCGYPHKGLFGDQKPYRRMCGKGGGFGGDRCTESLEDADLIPEGKEVEGEVWESEILDTVVVEPVEEVDPPLIFRNRLKNRLKNRIPVVHII